MRSLHIILRTLHVPVFSSNKSGTDITFSYILSSNNGEIYSEIIGANYGEVYSEKYPVKCPVKYTVKYTVNDSQNKIINILIKNPEITLDQLATEIGMSISGIKKNINQLKKLGIIERKGSDKTGYWEIKV